MPANAGQPVALHLRERVLESVKRAAESGKKPHVVLFVHGGFSPAPVAYDLDYKDFSWMEYLARAGFDVFALTHTAYGYSPKPFMDDPLQRRSEAAGNPDSPRAESALHPTLPVQAGFQSRPSGTKSRLPCATSVRSAVWRR